MGEPRLSVAERAAINAGHLPEHWDPVVNVITEHLFDHLLRGADQQRLRMMRSAPKAQRKAFRRAEPARMERINQEGRSSVASTPAPSVASEAPLRRPQKSLKIPVKSQDPQEAMAAISSRMNRMNNNPMKVASVAPLRRPQKSLKIPVKSQDPQEAMAAISSRMNRMDINPMKVASEAPLRRPQKSLKIPVKSQNPQM